MSDADQELARAIFAIPRERLDELKEQAIKGKIDLHRRVVMEALKLKDINEVTTGQRNISKMVLFGYLYGAEPSKILDYWKLPVSGRSRT